MKTKVPSDKIILLYSMEEKLPRKKKKAVQSYFRTHRKMFILDEGFSLAQSEFTNNDEDLISSLSDSMKSTRKKNGSQINFNETFKVK